MSNELSIPALPGGVPSLAGDFERVLSSMLAEVHGNLIVAPPDVLRGYMLGLSQVTKSLERDRKDTLAPYKEATEVIQGFYKTHQARLDGAVAAVKGRLLTLVQEAEAAARAREAAEAAAPSDRPTAALLPRTTEEIKPRVSTYTVRHLEITDPAGVPREFLTPDTEKIKTYLETGATPAWARLVSETRIAAR